MTPDGDDKTVCAALLCTASDVPATRKLGGFVGHGSLKGCSRCLKPFPATEFGTKPDYSDFQQRMWPKHSLQDHRTQGMNWKHANTLKKDKTLNMTMVSGSLNHFAYLNLTPFVLQLQTYHDAVEGKRNDSRWSFCIYSRYCGQICYTSRHWSNSSQNFIRI